MDLTDEDVREFAELWKAEFSEVLDAAAARLQASSFLELYVALAKPLPPAE